MRMTQIKRTLTTAPMMGTKGNSEAEQFVVEPVLSSLVFPDRKVIYENKLISPLTKVTSHSLDDKTCFLRVAKLIMSLE